MSSRSKYSQFINKPPEQRLSELKMDKNKIRSEKECYCACTTMRYEWIMFKKRNPAFRKNLLPTIRGMIKFFRTYSLWLLLMVIVFSLVLIFDDLLTWYTGIGNNSISENSGLSSRGSYGDQYGVLNTLFSGLAFIGFLLALKMQRDDLNLQRTEMEETRNEMKEQTKHLERQVEIAEIQSLYSCIPFNMERMEKLYARAESGLKKGKGLNYNVKNTLGCNSVHHIREVFIGIYNMTRNDTHYQKGILSELQTHLHCLSLIINFCEAWATYIKSWEHQIDYAQIKPEKKAEIYPNIWNSLFYDDLTLLSICNIKLGYVNWTKEEIEYLGSNDELKRPSLHHLLIAIPDSIPVEKSGELMYSLLCLVRKNINFRSANTIQPIQIILKTIKSAQGEYQRFPDELKVIFKG